MQDSIQPTVNVLRVSRLFLSRPDSPRTGFDVAKHLKLKHSTVYSLLWRLDKAGWLVSEDIQDGNRIKRLYKLTDRGIEVAGSYLSALQITST